MTYILIFWVGITTNINVPMYNGGFGVAEFYSKSQCELALDKLKHTTMYEEKYTVAGICVDKGGKYR